MPRPKSLSLVSGGPPYPSLFSLSLSGGTVTVHDELVYRTETCNLNRVPRHRWRATKCTRPRSSCTTYPCARRTTWSCSSTRATAACWPCKPRNRRTNASTTSWLYRPRGRTTGRPDTVSASTWENPAEPPVCPSTSRWVIFKKKSVKRRPYSNARLEGPE